MAMKIEAARLMVYQAGFKLDAGDLPRPTPRWRNALPPIAAMQVTTDAVQVLGGAGYVHDWPVERYMRDAKVAQIFEGTNQIQRIVIARALLGSIARVS